MIRNSLGHQGAEKNYNSQLCHDWVHEGHCLDMPIYLDRSCTGAQVLLGVTTRKVFCSLCVCVHVFMQARMWPARCVCALRSLRTRD